MAEPIHPLKLTSVLLQYPSAARQRAVGELGPEDMRPLGREMRAFVAWYSASELGELERSYVETFDFAKRSSLHLTYHVHGDRRQRGMALLELKRTYAEAGLDPSPAELPDYLPLMLEFASLVPDPVGRELLERHRVAIELVRGALADEGSPWLAPVELVVDRLPSPTRRQLARVRRLAAEGPPSEEVGLEPFAPPEVMPR